MLAHTTDPACAHGSRQTSKPTIDWTAISKKMNRKYLACQVSACVLPLLSYTCFIAAFISEYTIPTVYASLSPQLNQLLLLPHYLSTNLLPINYYYCCLSTTATSLSTAHVDSHPQPVVASRPLHRPGGPHHRLQSEGCYGEELLRWQATSWHLGVHRGGAQSHPP